MHCDSKLKKHPDSPGGGRLGWEHISWRNLAETKGTSERKAAWQHCAGCSFYSQTARVQVPALVQVASLPHTLVSLPIILLKPHPVERCKKSTLLLNVLTEISFFKMSLAYDTVYDLTCFFLKNDSGY